MRNTWVGLLMGLLSFAATAQDDGMVTKPSKYSVSVTLDRLEAIIKEKGFIVFARIDHADAAAKAGLTMKPTQVLIFGNPKGGTPLMQAQPTVAIDLPPKALAWEDGNGKVFLTYNTAAYLQERHHLKGNEEPLKKLDAALEAMMNKAAE